MEGNGVNPLHRHDTTLTYLNNPKDTAELGFIFNIRIKIKTVNLIQEKFE